MRNLGCLQVGHVAPMVAEREFRVFRGGCGTCTSGNDWDDVSARLRVFGKDRQKLTVRMPEGSYPCDVYRWGQGIGTPSGD